MLRTRLAVLLGASLLAALGASVLLSVALFERHQTRELTALLRRELQRVTALMADPTVGEHLLTAEFEHLNLQLVGPAGEVFVPEGDPEPIPLGNGRAVWGGKDVVVASAPWILGGGVRLGTVRLSYDVSEALATRRALRSSLLIAAGLIALISAAIGLQLLRRQLRPLRRLAEEAAALDPSDPHLTLPHLPVDEVGEVGRALEGAVSAIRQRQQAERDALAGIAHELAAPLSVVAGQLEGLAAADPSPQIRAARDAARELLYTSQDLLTLARGELQVALEPSVVPLAEVAERVCAEYPGVVCDRPAAGLVLGSRERLAQAVRNLVRNAVQAATAPEQVVITVTETTGEVTLSVADDGPTLTDEASRRLFERNFTSKAAQGGSGIGLTIVKELVEMHGGRIVAEPIPGGGTRFTMTLPPLSAQLEE
ncbi:MAG: HAMP domain-containing histidine kinase [Trueperaceae bacterium]|nr:HAMP domain-containing histidine kinase [Trueperaceae bacterium]MCO5173578.1 HAMP domain-containing histidine kinase [Trueperaceae bacterium]MCW5818566.1 HAMP domain-containing histidine kinase [Trueperaceae bacterium]